VITERCFVTLFTSHNPLNFRKRCLPFFVLLLHLFGCQMLFLVQNGFRVVAHDRRGHGRSSQASSRNDMDGYAEDLAAVIEALDLKDATLVSYSTLFQHGILVVVLYQR
jgi:Serine aminopeptidase, S33